MGFCLITQTWAGRGQTQESEYLVWQTEKKCSEQLKIHDWNQNLSSPNQQKVEVDKYAVMSNPFKPRVSDHPNCENLVVTAYEKQTTGSSEKMSWHMYLLAGD